MAERTNLARLNVPTQKYVDTLVNVFSYANDLIKYSDSYVYGSEDDIRMRVYTVSCLDGTTARIAIFTSDDDNSYYAAIEVEEEWCEFTLLNSTKEKDTIRFNSPTGMHFYADDYILHECGGTPISDVIIGMMSNSKHIGEDVVYTTLNLAKEQGLL